MTVTEARGGRVILGSERVSEGGADDKGDEGKVGRSGYSGGDEGLGTSGDDRGVEEAWVAENEKQKRR